MALNIVNLVGKKVLITGHTGFKGSWLALMLNSLGASVSGISLVNDNENTIYSKANVSDILLKEYFIDIRNDSSLKKAIIDINPEYIFHLAAFFANQNSVVCNNLTVNIKHNNIKAEP